MGKEGSSQEDANLVLPKAVRRESAKPSAGIPSCGHVPCWAPEPCPSQPFWSCEGSAVYSECLGETNMHPFLWETDYHVKGSKEHKDVYSFCGQGQACTNLARTGNRVNI